MLAQTHSVIHLVDVGSFKVYNIFYKLVILK
jgi:hypothetical protein